MLKGYWKFNGNSNDYSGNGNNGTDTAITYSQANGRLNQGAGFNGSSSYINVAGSVSLQMSSFTISLWFKRTSSTASGNDDVLISKRTYAVAYPDAENYFVRLGSGGDMTNGLVDFGFLGTTGIWQTLDSGSILILDTKWHHVMCTFNETTKYAALYIDGKPVNSKTMTYGILLQTTYPLNIGRSTSPWASYRYSAASIDEIWVDNAALAPAKMKNEFSRIKGFF